MEAAFELIWEHSYGAVTIEAICERAGVKKGSFYYFFSCKSELAVAAVEAGWNRQKEFIDKLFSPEVPPLDRIRNYLDFIVQAQIEGYEAKGKIFGCPVFTLGSEICTQEEKIRSLVHGILTCLTGYLETAIREAQERGDVEGVNASLKARNLLSYFEGILARARIENNPELLRSLCADSLAMISSRQVLAVA